MYFTQTDPSRILDPEDRKQACQSQHDKKQQKETKWGMRDHTLEDHISSRRAVVREKRHERRVRTSTAPG
jgi:hypothetical protein